MNFRRQPCSPAAIETLEARIAPAALIFTVTTTADSGAGSLRQAIADANANSGVDEIRFDISGAGPHTIQVGRTTGIGQISSALPTILEAVIIDATTEPGYSGTPLIHLDGANAPVLSNGLVVAASGVTVKGLAITRFNANGISIGAADATVQASYIGFDPNGNPGANGASGVNITGNDALIGGTGAGEGNVISANTQDGVRISASGTVVAGNVIGLSVTGNAVLANGGAGVSVTGGTGNVIGGSSAAAKNIISGNVGTGVSIAGTASGNTVQLNFIGTDAAGNLGLANGVGVSLGGLSSGTSVIGNLISGNSGAGIAIASSANTVTANTIGLDATGAKAVSNGGAGIDITGGGNTIGGTTVEARNVVSGNTGAGLYLHGGSASDNTVSGNFIGVAPNGKIAIGNVTGIHLDGASDNAIEGNVISGNATGVSLTNSANGNSVRGNFIGTDLTGAEKLGTMVTGVVISDSSSNVIGGAAAADGNTIAYATGAGVQVLSGTANSILSNSIFLNQGLGIDLGGSGSTPNDVGNPPDGDSGANGLQNFPVLTSSTVVSAGTIRVSGQLDSTPNSQFTLQFFGNPDYDLFAAAAEGRNLLGSATVNTDGNGRATFTLSLPFSSADGPYVTASATSSAGATSEFSEYVTTRIPVTLVNSRLAVYPDADGDPAYVAISKGAFSQDNFLVVPRGEGGQLHLLDLARGGSQFDGAKLIINSGPVENGRLGTVNVGRIDARGIALAQVTVGGDLAQIDAGIGATGIGSLSVLSFGQLGRSTQNPTLADPLHSSIDGDIRTLTVAGDLLGTVEIDGAVRSLSVRGKLLGGDAPDSGRIAISGFLTKGTIGAIAGGSGSRAGSLQADSAGTLTVTRSITGGAGAASGSIVTSGGLASLTIGGDLRALESGAGADSASVLVEAGLSKVVIRGDLAGGRIAAGAQLGTVAILGDASGLIAAAGKSAPQSAAEALAIKSVTIAGTAARLSIIAGHDYTALGQADNANVQIGAIKVFGDLYASDISAGMSAGADGFYGTADDAAYAGGNSVVSRIASITVAGTADGTPYSVAGGHKDHFGIVAKQIGAMSIGNRKLGLTGGQDNVAIGSTEDYRVREV